MAVHLPLSDETQKEVSHLMLASKNILNPKDGTPIVAPSQDMILGLYYLTLDLRDNDYVGKIFSNPKELLMAFNKKIIQLHTPVAIPASTIDNARIPEANMNDLLITTLGRYIINDVTPDNYPYLNESTPESLRETPKHYFVKKGTNVRDYMKSVPTMVAFKKNHMSNIILDVFENYDVETTATMVDLMKEIGYKYSTLSGISISYSDLGKIDDKESILKKAQAEVEL